MRVTIRAIQVAVARHYQLPLRIMTDNSVFPSHAGPRQVAMYLARHLTDKSFESIGRYFGGRDHTTVIHAVKTVERKLADDELAASVASLRSQLIPSSAAREDVASLFSVAA